MFPTEISELAQAVIDQARARGLKLATAESCTGGLVAGAICALSGASDVFERGLVTYSNGAKSSLVGVPPELISSVGAVSEEVARAMAAGALAASDADVTVAITGVAGPGGGSVEKPVGTVHFASARRGQPVIHRHEHFPQDTRQGVQLAAVAMALQMLKERL